MTEDTSTGVDDAVDDGRDADAGPSADGLDLDALPGGAKAALEAVLMVVDEPVGELDLATALALPVDRIRTLLAQLRAEYDGYGPDGADGAAGLPPRGFELRNVAGGWRFFSRSEFAPVVSRFVLEGQTARLTQAALETLAVIAYRQPVSRARVSAIRGVNVDSVVRTLTARGMIEDAGTDPESGALLYRTTSYFLERMGLGSIDELPQIAPHLPGLDALDDYDDAGY
ncbi:segregation and condensation protein B [Tersicoccus solisilvae]|uniref:Segregation and condensation protein B n=1 Tax=Tersicoccus solisilvae TaxID=1882339 RepID=A0ABQ1NSB7_9MICC|nr:SMC-Scp complex subunit ScpB [Tersicoccus solisilvae]GGC83764.1 segregation and condensation protein B [Tersicoccus solisilvae]